jgi:hypothetical protein
MLWWPGLPPVGPINNFRSHDLTRFPAASDPGRGRGEIRSQEKDVVMATDGVGRMGGLLRL